MRTGIERPAQLAHRLSFFGVLDFPRHLQGGPKQYGRGHCCSGLCRKLSSRCVCTTGMEQRHNR